MHLRHFPPYCLIIYTFSAIKPIGMVIKYRVPVIPFPSAPTESRILHHHILGFFGGGDLLLNIHALQTSLTNNYWHAIMGRWEGLHDFALQLQLLRFCVQSKTLTIYSMVMFQCS